MIFKDEGDLTINRQTASLMRRGVTDLCFASSHLDLVSVASLTRALMQIGEHGRVFVAITQHV